MRSANTGDSDSLDEAITSSRPSDVPTPSDEPGPESGSMVVPVEGIEQMPLREDAVARPEETRARVVLSENGDHEEAARSDTVQHAESSEMAPYVSPVVESESSVTLVPKPREPRLRKARERIARSWLWRSRGFWLGALGLGLALYGQRLVTEDRQIVHAIRWYALGIVVMVIGWLGTYKNKSGLVVPIKKAILATTLPTRSGSRRAATQVGFEPYNAPAQSRQRWLPPWRRSSASGAGGQGEQTALRGRWNALTTRFPIIVAPWPRYLLAAVALGVNLWSANQIRQDYFSVAAGWGWFLSLVVLALAFVRERPRPARDLDAADSDIEGHTDLRIPRRAEFWIVVGIIAVALLFRFYRLGDWFTGMHGDEGEAGVDALNIMEGRRVSIFQTGWFAQPNFYYYGIARVMNVFGTDLFGLRMFSLLVGSAMLVPFYLLVRMWFGVRAALIALTFLSISGAAVHFTKVEFSNITWPTSLVLGFYFLARGLKSKRNLDFVFSAYGFMLSLYFYNGGRLTPIMLVGVVAYIFLLAPLLRLPGAYGEARRLVPTLGRLRALGRAARTQSLSVLHYFPQVLVFLVACLAAASAFGVYYLDNQALLDSRARDKIVFNNEGLMAARYGRTHEPLYVGLRWPTPDDIYPVSPLVFEQTPLSVKVSDDGFWPRVLWDQMTTTLSMLTYRFETSSVYTFTMEAVAKPIEAVLIILGIAWALVRWRDTRMAMLCFWFWSAVLAGGVMTIDAPYMARMSGVIPVLAIFAALPLNKLAAELTGVVAGFRLSPARWRVHAGQTAGALAAVTLLTYLSFQNWNDYYGRYLAQSPLPFSEVTGQSYFVREMNRAALAEGKPKPKYFNLGAHFIYWSHGDNRFLNHGTDGIDMVNASNELPVLDDGDRDLYFMVWDVNRHYLDIIKNYYPEGIQEEYAYGPAGRATRLFTYYKVPREHLAEQRGSTATYTPESGPTLRRDEPGVGSVTAPPEGLEYPVRAEWATHIVAPAFGRYRLSFEAPGDGSLSVDGQTVITTTAAVPQGEAELLLARGPHSIILIGALASGVEKVKLEWSAATPDFEPVPPRYLWNGPGRAFYGVVGPYTGFPLMEPERPAPEGISVLAARVDGFIGFRDASNAIGVTGEAIWRGTLDITQPGTYSFEMITSGAAAIFVDGRLVSSVATGSGLNPTNSTPGIVELTTGSHEIEMRAVVAGTPYLEVFWTPPGGMRTLLGGPAFQAAGGIVDPRSASEPPPVQLQPELPPVARRPQTLMGGTGTLLNPRGLAVDDEGYVYVGDRGNGRVVVFGPNGSEAHAWGKAAPKDGASPGPGEFVEVSDVAVGADGTVYVMDIGAARLQAFTRDGTFKWALDNSVLGAGSPNGIGIAADGTIYIASTAQSRLLKLTPAAFSDVAPGAPDAIDGGEEMGRLDQPVDVAPDPSVAGQLFALDLRNRIVKLDASGKIVEQWSLLIGLDDGAGRLAISGDGTTAYVTDPDRNRVAVVGLADGTTTYFGVAGSDEGQFQGLSGIALGPDGRVYVLDRKNNRVQVFNP